MIITLVGPWAWRTEEEDKIRRRGVMKMIVMLVMAMMIETEA